MIDWTKAHLQGAAREEIDEIKQEAPEGKWDITLTFDDGPENKANRTGRILETLELEKIKGTFFLLGNRVDNDPFANNIMKNIYFAGHYIGSHSYEHVPHTTLDNTKIVEYINKSKKVLQPYLYNIFRLPFGDGFYGPGELKGEDRENYLKKQKFIIYTLKDEGFQHISWNSDPEDWKVIDLFGENVLNYPILNHKARKQVILKALNDINNSNYTSGVMLFHDDCEHTVRNLRYYIEVLRGLGHRIVGLEHFTGNPPTLLTNTTKETVIPLKS